MYWKSSKEFVDKRAVHMRDSMCITDPTDRVFHYHGWLYPNGHIVGPAGAFTFHMKNVTFAGDPGHAGALAAGQHCLDGGSGGPCNVQYFLEDVNFSGVPADRRSLNFGVHARPPAEVLPVFIAKDGSLGGHRSIVSQHLNGFEAEGCVKLDSRFDSGYGCPFHVRRLNLWSREDLGNVTLSGPGYNVEANWGEPAEGRNAGHLSYAAGYNGYGALAIVGQNYTFSVNVSSDVFVDFSDARLPALFDEDEEVVHLTFPGGECEARASEAHGLFYERFGPKRRASSGDCQAALALPCHTTVEGDECYTHVSWAHSWGLASYPFRFPGVDAGASWEDIQMFYYLTYQGECPEPCPASDRRLRR